MLQAVSLKKNLSLVCLIVLLGLGSNLHAQWTGPERQNAENLTVMIDAYYKGRTVPEWGTGVIVGRRNNTLYIATAKHVLQRGQLAKIEVAFRWLNQQPGDHLTLLAATLARPLSALDPKIDLAALKVDLQPGQVPPPDALLFSVLSDPTLLKVGDAVRPLGHANGRFWDTCTNPDAITSNSKKGITFDSKCTAAGDSGGPLFDEKWHIAGMITMDQPDAFAPSIDGVLGLMKAWNLPSDLITPNSPEFDQFLSVSVGTNVACGLTRSNHAYCWGSNVHYALGAGTEENYKVEVGLPVATSYLFSMISTGSEGACGLTLGKSVLCWGDNSRGQLGNGTTEASPRPVAISGGFKFDSISSGHYHVCGLTQDGIAYCWGSNEFGELGNGTKTDSSIPVRVSSSARWLQISAGTFSTCAISTEHDVYCWGGRASLLLKPDSTNTAIVPKHILEGMKFSQLSVGGSLWPEMRSADELGTLACGITTDGLGYCWGANANEWLQIWPETTLLVPISPEYKYTAVSVGDNRACGITQMLGEVHCFEAAEDHHGLRAKPIETLEETFHAKVIGLGKMVSCIVTVDNRTFCSDISPTRVGASKVMDPFGEGEPFSKLSAFGFIHLSRCKGTSLPNPPKELVESDADLDGILEGETNNIAQMQQEGRLPKDPPGVKSITDIDTLVANDLPIVISKIRTCEIPVTDPIVNAFKKLVDLRVKLDLAISGLDFSQDAASKATLAADISSVQEIVKQYRDAASLKEVTDFNIERKSK